MARRHALLAAAIGLLGAVLYGRLRWRRRVEELAAPAGADPRAEALRHKLEEVRGLESERDEFESAETPVDRAEPLADLDERRRQVRDQGRRAAREMRGED